MTDCAISAPEKPSLATANSRKVSSSMSIPPLARDGVARCDVRCNFQISSRSMRVGRSTKRFHRIDPCEEIPAGGCRFCWQSRSRRPDFSFLASMSKSTKDALTGTGVPASPDALNPFSISSIQRIEGATASASLRALRMFCSLEPTRPEKTLPTSSRSNGKPHCIDTHDAVRLFPQPGTPVMSSPLGAGSDHSFASGNQAPSRFNNHFFKLSRPPTSSKLPDGDKFE